MKQKYSGSRTSCAPSAAASAIRRSASARLRSRSGVLTICSAATRKALSGDPPDAAVGEAVDDAADEDEETCVSLMSVSKNSRQGRGANRWRRKRRSRLAGDRGAARRSSDQTQDRAQCASTV